MKKEIDLLGFPLTLGVLVIQTLQGDPEIKTNISLFETKSLLKHFHYQKRRFFTENERY
jgi:hypothetical protein